MLATQVMILPVLGFGLTRALALGRLLRVSNEDRATIGIGFAVRNVGLASAVGITLLNRIEYAVFAGVYFLTEVPLLPGSAARGSVSYPPVVR
jgi:predicted Na+-dependent transporter